LLIQKGLISEKQLFHALDKQKESGFLKKLGEILVEEGYISQKEMAIVLSKQLNIDFIDLYGQKIDFRSLERFSFPLLLRANAIPFKEDDDYIYIATSDPLNYDDLELLERNVATKPIKIFLAFSSDIKHIFQRLEIIKKTDTIALEIKHEIHNESTKGNDSNPARSCS